MARHNELGKNGEKAAVAYLARNGYQIIETNWRCGRKEIDIIARKGDLIIIVEVKSRRTNYFGEPEEAVTLKKQKRIIIAADYYLQKLDYDAEVQYDIISIIINKDGMEINHIEEAFRPLAE